MDTIGLTGLGWGPFFEEAFRPFRDAGLSPMRIIRENRGKYTAVHESGESVCEVSGKFRFEAKKKSDFPTVGDWVAACIRSNEKNATIHALVLRKSFFSRKVAGIVTDEQAVAANIDTVFIVTGLDDNFNLRRIERYLALAWNSGAVPVVILNKSDLCPQTESRKNSVESIALGVDVHVLSAARRDGIEALGKYLQPGKTVAFLGSSGVGKSTIINALLGTKRQKVNEVSGLGSRGRHSTTSRELMTIPGGGIVIDTPGMRELQAWGDEDGLKQTFKDIEELASRCQFKDCGHVKEPGCAVRESVQNGFLDPKRLESYFKLKKEFAYMADRQTMTASAIEKARWKPISVLAKNMKKDKP